MADDNKLILEIVLENGSVLKGFATIKDEAKKTADATKKEFNTIGDALDFKPLDFAKEKLKQIPLAFAGIAAGAVAAGLAIKEAFDLALEGEKIKALEKQFHSLAEGAGISGDALEESLKKASNGLVNFSELIPFSNRAIVDLGSQASKLPQIMELARKSAAAFGGDIQANFEGIIQAATTGNLRALKFQGIIIDSDKALKDYAKTLGIAASELNQAQKQQALLNAILEQGGDKFKNLAENTKPLTVGVKQISVALEEMKESLAKATAEKFGGDFIRIADNISASLGNTSAKSRVLEADVVRLKEAIANNKDASPGFVNSLNQALDQANKKLLAFKATQDIALVENDDKRKASRSSVGKEAEEEVKAKLDAFNKLNQLTAEQILAEQNRANQITAIRLQANNELLNVELAQTQFIGDEQKRRLAQEEIYGQQLLLLGQQREQALADADAKFAVDKGFSEEQRQEARLATIESYNAKEIELRAKQDSDLLNRQKQISETIKNVLVSGLSATFQRLGESLAQGKSLFDDFGKSVLGILGDMAIQVGTLTIAHGIATTALGESLATFNGAAAVAAGAALVVIGGALKAMSGGLGSINGGVASGGAGFGGGSVSDSNSFTKPEDIKPQERIEEKPSVQLIVQGDILDSDQTANRILGLLNDAFDKSGVELRGATA